MPDKRIKHPDKLAPEYKARHWAYKHGFYGEIGGWIYRRGDPNRGRAHKYSPKPICQGWTNFYRMYGRRIEVWFSLRYEKAQRKIA